MAGSTTSQGTPARVAASSRPRTVWDFPPPVAPHTKTCRFRDSSGTRSGPAGIRCRSSTCPSGTVLSCHLASGRSAGLAAPVVGAAARTGGPASWEPAGGVSGVTSKSGRSASRIPGISASGLRVSAASRPVLAWKEFCGPVPSPSDRPARPGRPALPGDLVPHPGRAAVSVPGRPSRSRNPAGLLRAGASVYGKPLRSADAHTRPATRAAAGGSAPPASRWTSHMPVDNPWRNSVCRCRSRRASTSRSGNRSAIPVASRSPRAVSSASQSSSAGGTGSATTSQPNGPGQAGSRQSSRDGAAWTRSGCGSPAATRSPSLIPPIDRQQASPDMAGASAPRPRARPRAPPGRASITSPAPVLPASAAPAARIWTGPPA